MALNVFQLRKIYSKNTFVAFPLSYENVIYKRSLNIKYLFSDSSENIEKNIR